MKTNFIRRAIDAINKSGAKGEALAIDYQLRVHSGHLCSVSSGTGTFFMVRVVESNSNRSACLMFLYLSISIAASSIE